MLQVSRTPRLCSPHPRPHALRPPTTTAGDKNGKQNKKNKIKNCPRGSRKSCGKERKGSTDTSKYYTTSSRRTEQHRTEPNRIKPNRIGPDGTKPSRIEPSLAEVSRTESSRTEPNQTERTRTEPSRAKRHNNEPIREGTNGRMRGRTN